MVLVELVRLIIVLALTAAGYSFGSDLLKSFGPAQSSPESARLIASVLGAGIGYVGGGIFGRSLLSGIGAVETRVERVSGAELVTGTLGLLVGATAAILLSWPLIALVPYGLISYPISALLVVSLSYLGLRIAGRKRFEILGLMGLSQSLMFTDGERMTGPRVLDTSAIIDGRIADVARSGFLSGHMVCPAFVLNELRTIADSGDANRRGLGRRGLDVLEALQAMPHLKLEVTDDVFPDIEDVDEKLISLAKRMEGALVTTDYNLHKTAELQGISVLNVNSLAALLKPAVTPGEQLRVKIVREGTQADQGVGYLTDGTMVVVEGGSSHVGGEIDAVVTSVLQTPAGRMIFSTVGDMA